jgi:hypothetical protein
MTHIVHLAAGADFMSRALSQVARKFIVSELRGETAGEIVMPSCDPAAQVGNPQFTKPVSGKVPVGRLAMTAGRRDRSG